MILGFKDQFEPWLLDGSKQHTIRAGKRWREGMRADLFVRPRRQDMRLLFRSMVTHVEDISLLAAVSDAIPTGGIVVFLRGAVCLRTVPGRQFHAFDVDSRFGLRSWTACQAAWRE